MTIKCLESDAVTDQKIAQSLARLTQLDVDFFKTITANKDEQNETDLFITEVARCLLTGDIKALSQGLGKTALIQQGYLQQFKRACQTLCSRHADDTINSVVEFEASGISNPLSFVLVAEAQLMKKQYTEAFHNFSKAASKFVFNGYLIIKSRLCLQHIEATVYSPPLEAGAVDYLKDPRFDSAGISLLVSSLLKHKYQLYTGCEAALAAAFPYGKVRQDEFLQEAMQRLLLPDPDIELFLIQIRKVLLSLFLKANALPEADLGLLCALSFQACLNEHVHLVTENELEAISTVKGVIKELLNQPNVSAEELAALILLVSLYEPLSEQPYFSKLLQYSRAEWPAEMQLCLEKILYQPKEELELVDAIPCLTPIQNETSRLVGAQYEVNPYPRWFEVNQIASEGGYIKYHKIHKPPYQKMKTLDKTLKVLVAGCGTGKQPIALALKFPDVQITAVDLSRRSLAYAKLMAKQFNVQNISFYQGDILELAALEDRFNIIECMGVLHHMREPSAGLRVLKSLLVKKGVMKLGLYSEIARKEIANFRAENRLAPTRENIRSMRHSVIRQEREKYEACLKSDDFYSTSMCRDLLFHAQEHTFSLPELSRLLKDNKLSFKGFTFKSPETFKRFQANARSPSTLFDLKAWHQFEQRNPLTFAGMYQFFAQAN